MHTRHHNLSATYVCKTVTGSSLYNPYAYMRITDETNMVTECCSHNKTV